MYVTFKDKGIGACRVVCLPAAWGWHAACGRASGHPSQPRTPAYMHACMHAGRHAPMHVRLCASCSRATAGGTHLPSSSQRTLRPQTTSQTSPSKPWRQTRPGSTTRCALRGFWLRACKRPHLGICSQGRAHTHTHAPPSARARGDVHARAAAPLWPVRHLPALAQHSNAVFVCASVGKGGGQSSRKVWAHKHVHGLWWVLAWPANWVMPSSKPEAQAKGRACPPARACIKPLRLKCRTAASKKGLTHLVQCCTEQSFLRPADLTRVAGCCACFSCFPGARGEPCPLFAPPHPCAAPRRQANCRLNHPPLTLKRLVHQKLQDLSSRVRCNPCSRMRPRPLPLPVQLVLIACPPHTRTLTQALNLYFSSLEYFKVSGWWCVWVGVGVCGRVG